MSNWKNYLANGIPVKNGADIPTRKEIFDLSDEEMFLFVEGLRRFQEKPAKDDPLSYYQIAGIHGVPYTTWPNQDWNKDIKRVPGRGFGGFCTHSSVLFVTWHRPFLALYESTLYTHVNAVADSIPESAGKANYQKLAQNFRIPYWDWARRDVPTFPKACLTSSVSDCYKSPNFKPPFEQTKENPLFRFRWPKGSDKNLTTCTFYNDNDEVVGRREYDSTQRYPSLNGPSEPGSVTQAVLDFFKRQEINNPELGIPKDLIPMEKRNLSERVAYLLQAYQRYGPVSYNTYEGSTRGPLQKPEIWGSFEDIHNTVHGLIGGGAGQMSNPAVSAFDPTFWLHHANIDRIYAIWQALHEDPKDTETFVTPQATDPQYGASFAKPAGYVENETTPLWPFRKQAEGSGDSVWWTSKDAKRTETFGYAYPEIKGFQYPGTEDTRKPLRTTIRQYYSSAPAEVARSMKGNPNAGKFMLQQTKVLSNLEPQVASVKTLAVSQVPQFDVAEPDELLAQSADDNMPFLKDLAPDNTYLEWLVNVKAQKHAFGGRMQVHFFLGPPPADSDPMVLWQLSPYHVGSFVTFGQDDATSCEKCQVDQANDLEITGQVPLTIALFERYLAKQIGDLGEEAVRDYLKVNLHWRVAVGGGGTISDRSVVPGLKVMVVSNKVTVPEDPDEAPIYDPNVTIHPTITTREGDDQGAGRGNGTGVSILEVQG